MQLLELRAVVARMLGLDVSTLPVPDVEILNRIERLVRAHDENSLAAFTADRDLEHVSREFRSGEILYSKYRLSTHLPSPSRKQHRLDLYSYVIRFPKATTRRADCSDADARRSAAARRARSRTTTSAAAVRRRRTGRRRTGRRRASTRTSTRAATEATLILPQRTAALS